MRLLKSSTVRKYLRIWHRDLGFLLVGASLIYAISGILLNHMGGKDPAFKTQESTVQLEKGLSEEVLNASWKQEASLPELKRIMQLDEEHYRLMLKGGIGVYSTQTGLVDYEKHERREFVYWINRLHYSKVKGWNVMADFFAASLIFFALSGLLMVKGKNSIAGRGKWFLIVGILIPIIYICLAG
ncbi:MAG: PepSY-associated TM helix domain-containing protein [Mangrovibacterium sp.]